MTSKAVRHLVLILGDQLDRDNAALADLDRARDRILMVECLGESQHVWSHKARTALFLSAMRHHAQALKEDGLPIDYWALGTHPHQTLSDAWQAAIQQFRPEKVVACEPGEWRIERMLYAVCEREGVPLVLRDDAHFLLSRADFLRWAGSKASLRMEVFYRMMRIRTGVLMDEGEPVGGVWNFDHDNRGTFGKAGPGDLPGPPHVEPDAITREVMAQVEAALPDHPGELAAFGWPVTRGQALAALKRFVDERLPHFGAYQDAIWTGQPFLYHALLSTSLNLKLLHPREVIDAAQAAWRRGAVPLASAEGFIRQILGWREFIRGVYWRDMPGLSEANYFGHGTPLPSWYWTGETAMRCLRETIGQTLRHGYAHHIQRLMVTGNFALVAGLSPQEVSAWYLAVYVDAVEWVERPNTAGMSLYANGGRFTSKPYAASGAYIRRMSNYCSGCRYRPELRTGAQACPMTTFYWDFLDRNQSRLENNPRAVLMLRNLERMTPSERTAVRDYAAQLRERIDSL